MVERGSWSFYLGAIWTTRLALVEWPPKELLIGGKLEVHGCVQGLVSDPHTTCILRTRRACDLCPVL